LCEKDEVDYSEPGSIILTSNKHVRDWPEIFAGDEILTTAILDRLLHHVHIVHIDGRNCRLRDLDGLLRPPRPLSPTPRPTKEDQPNPTVMSPLRSVKRGVPRLRKKFVSLHRRLRERIDASGH